MAQILQSIMGNFMFICIPSILYFVFWTKYGEKAGKMQKLVLLLFLGITLVLCMTFPYDYESRYRLDFRLIPLVLGVLYGGPWVGGALLAILAAYRCMIGINDGTYFSVLSAAITYLSLILIMKKVRLNNRKKLFVALIGSAVLFPVSLQVTWVSLHYIELRDTLRLTIFKVIEFSAIWVTVYLVELFCNHIRIRMELQEIEKMRVISQIAASVSHEIRNPLTTVKGLLQLFKEKELPADKRANLTDVALHELTTAINIISDYLTFAKPQIAKMTPLDLSTELQQVVSVLTPYANMQQVALTIDVDSNQPILGDSQQFRQSLINLVKNCIEASSNGKVDLTVVMRKGAVVIRIQDTGCGMTEDQIGRLGTPYYSTKEKGTGLGTMVAFSIIRAMNGTIHVESEVNKGSLFEISFPIEDSA
ncbi:two-component system sporulation sensor kinase B [Paenibacillus taihuensis]|uniref:histidine kinase n=1 Tax=Paenibacillus taihuensis TaxID=1156355 RepID=A0A3D9SCX7_9BACL|nr:sensor histidine kinase [Paenibacillus taihuensis]REE92738.1 two-component system sporulation sensor kinase B [Paenibacillus taihuensis]